MMPTVADVEQTHVPPLLVAPPLPTEGVDVYAVSQKLEGMSPPKALTEHYLRGSPLAADNSLGLEQPPSVVSSTDMSRESSAPLESTPLTNRDASGRPTRKGTFGWNTPVSHRGATPEREREPSVPRREQLTFTQPFQAAAQPIIVPLKDESDDHDPTINRPRKDTFGPLDFRPPYSADGNSTPSPTRSTPGIDGLETSYQPLITPATPRKNQDATAPVEYRPVASPAPDATRPVSGNWFTTGADVEPAPAPGLAPEAAQSPELDTGARPASGGWFLDPPASTEARPPMVRSDTEEERQALRTMPRSAVTPISWPLNNTSAASMASSVASVVDETPMVSAAGSPMSTSDSIVESEAHAPLLTESSVTSDSEDDVFISPPMAPYISDPPETPSEYMTPFEDSEGDDTTSSEAAQVTPKHQATKSMTPTTPRTLLEAPFPQTSPEAAASPRATPKTAVTEIASPRYHPLLSPRNVPARDSPVRPAPPTLDVERARQEDVDSDSDELSPTDPMIITPAVDAFFGPDSQGVSPKSAKSAPAPAFVRDLAAEYEAGSPRRWSPLRPRMFPSPEPDAALADASFTIPRSMSTRSVASADKIKQDTMDALEELEKLVNQEMRTQEEISLQCTPMSDEVDVMPTVPTIVDLSESPFVPSEPLPQVEAAVEMDAEVSLRDILASAPDTTILDEPPLSATTISSSRSSSFGLEYLRRSIGSEPCEDRPLGYQRSIPSESGSPLPLSLSSLNRLSPIPPNRLPLPAGASPPPNPPPVLSPSPLWAQSPLLLSTQHPTKAVESPSSPGTATPAGTAVATLVTERAQEDSPIDEFPPRPASHASSIPDPVSSAAARALMASPVRGSSPCTVETGESNETVRAAIKRRPPPLRTTPPLTSKSLIVGSDKFNDTLEQLSAALGTAFRLSSNGMYVQASASDLSVIMERIKKIRLPESATTNNGTHLSPARVSPHAPPLSAFGPSVFPGHKRSPRSSPAPSPRGYSGPNSPATPMSATTKAYYPSPPVVAREKVSTAPRPVSSDLVGASDASRVTRTDSVRSSSGGSETASTRRHLHTEGLRRIEREEAAIFRKANKHHGHGGSLPGSPRTKRPSRTPVSSVSPVGSPQALESMANRYPRVPLARSSRGSRTAASISSLMELTKQATASETGSQLERRASSSSLGHSVFQVPRKPLPCDSGDWSQTQGTPASLYGPLADVRETARETADISPSIYMPNPAQYRPEPGYLARAEPVYAAEPEPPVYAAEPEPAYTQVPVGRLPPPRPEQVIAAKSTGFGYGYQIPRAFADGRSPTTPQFEPSSLSQFQTMPMPLPPVAVAMPPPPPVATATSTSRMKPPRSYRLTFGRD
jgi:hypothetical protein